nr:hypothetical protein [Tanacetum cinerariifolium]
MPIPDELISNNIINAPYYNAYLEIVAKHDRKMSAEKEETKKTASAKQPKPMPAIGRLTKPAPAPKPKATKERIFKAFTAKPPKPKPAKEKSTKTTPPLKAGKGEGDKDDMELAIQMSLESFQAQSQAHIGGVAIREPVAEATRPLPVVEGKVTEKASTGPTAQAQDDTFVNIIRDSPSPADAETKTCVASEKTNNGGKTEILQIDEEQGKDVDDQEVMDEDQARPDLEEATGLLLDQTLSPRTSLWLICTQRDLPHKIDEAVRESVKEAVHIALQALLRDRFRELPETDMKEILHQWMFKIGSYKSLLKHVALYEALEASWNEHRWMSFLLKRTSLARDDVMIKTLLLLYQIRILVKGDDMTLTLLRPEWLKPIPDDERPATPEPAWVIPSSHIPDALNNWANALATTYQAPTENSLLEKNGDMQTFMHCSKWKSITRCLQIRLTGLIQKVEDFQLGIESYQKQLNLTKPGWDAKGFEYKHDYTIIDSPHAVVFPVGKNERKIMRFNEIYKFSDGTLTNIMEALDFRVKEYKTQDQKDLPKPGMLCDSDVYTLEDPTFTLEILSRRFFLRLNLPDHWSVLIGSAGSSKDGDGDTSFQWSLFHYRMLILDRYILRTHESSSVCFKASATLISKSSRSDQVLKLKELQER